MMRDLWGDTLPQEGETIVDWEGRHQPVVYLGSVRYGTTEDMSELSIHVFQHGDQMPEVRDAVESICGRFMRNVRR